MYFKVSMSDIYFLFARWNPRMEIEKKKIDIAVSSARFTRDQLVWRQNRNVGGHVF